MEGEVACFFEVQCTWWWKWWVKQRSTWQSY